MRGLHSAVYDPATNRMIVFGGNNACEDARNDVWVLEDANGYGTPNWIELTPSNAPILPGGGSSGGHSAVYEANNRMIVFIGVWCCANDVYVLENANGLGGTPTWIQLSPIGTPPSARAGQTAVYDPGSNQMILFGGLVGNFANDVWVLEDANGDGTPEWIELSPAGGPPVVRESHTAIYNPAANRMTVFGGRTSGQSLNDVWVLTVIVQTNQPPIAEAGFSPIDVEEDEGLFEIVATATDPDDNLEFVVAVIELPSLDGLEIELEVEDDIKIEFDLGEGKVEIKGPNPEALLAEIQQYDGLLVNDGDFIQIEIGDDPAKYELKFEDGVLNIEANQVTLRVTATDTEGATDTATASPVFAT